MTASQPGPAEAFSTEACGTASGDFSTKACGTASGPRNWSMAVISGSDSVLLSNGSISTSTTNPCPLIPSDGDLTAQQLTPREAPRTKASPNGCLQLNGTVKSSFLPLDNQRTPQMSAQCCHPCPYHHPVTSHNNHQECHPEVGPTASSALASCCMQPHSEYSASRCPHHSPVYQAAHCLQPPPSFCLHHPWPDHFQHQPVRQHLAVIRPSRPFKFPRSYAALLADWPVVVLGMCTLLIVVCALVGVLVPELPDFSDPLLGFEPRGTAIGQRLVTWNNMMKNTGYKATLANYPYKYAEEQAKSHREDRWSDDHHERERREVDWNFQKDSFFCDVPSDGYSRVVFAPAGGETLWNLPAIKSMCDVDNSRIRSHPQFSDLCQRTTAVSCCPSWTLGNYIAILNNRSSCQKIVERDVSHTLKLLRTCAKHYQNGTLGPDCWDKAARRKDQLKCTSVPRKCTKYNAVYQILHYLVDKDFITPKTADYAVPALKYSMLFSPTEKGESMMNIYLDNFENWNSSDGITTVTGIEFGIKHSLFQDYLLMDTVYPAIAIVIVLLIMCVYTKSMFITLMTMFAIISSLIVSYFLYRVVFNFEFFPFMNLTALIILVGIGADDAFVLCDVWNYTKFDKPRAETSEAVLPCIVIRFRYLWLVWFLALMIGGAYIVCINPKMKLPSLELSEFQVFRSSHPFERYDAEFKKLFMFERVHHGEELHMPITVIWGVSPEDSGNPLNPKSKGKLTLDRTFNIASPASQAWILHFCQKLRNQTFFYQTDQQDFTSCFIETFKQWMENQDCDEPALYPCCSHCSFPYKQEVFELCIKKAIMELDRSTGYHLNNKTPGPRFDINDTIRAVVLEFQSTFLFTLAYEKMQQFYKEVDSWISSELSSAPEGLSHGWFVSNLEFYDLQDSLSDGTLIAMGLSVAVAFSVMLLTTWNIIISLYAIISIAGTIFVTVGSLVLLGWELNVLESVTISVAVGLSVDFAVHYGVAYRLAPDPDREGKVIFSLSRMGSAIAMAALTTFVAGAMMMPSTVLAYTQLGTFMMLVMCISWAFATFFFQCLCRCLGPQGTCGQIPLPKKLQCSAFSHTLSADPGDRGPSETPTASAYRVDARGQNSELEHEFYELQPLASHSCTTSKKNTYEEPHICSEFFNGQAKNLGMPVPAAYNSDLTKSPRNEPGSALLQPCLEQDAMCHLSLNQRCSCPNAYTHLKYGPHPCQQTTAGDSLCHQCASTASSFVQIQNVVAPLQATHQAAEVLMHPARHMLPPGMQNSQPRNFFLHPVQCIQAQEQLGHSGIHNLQSVDDHLPRTAEPLQSVSRSTECFQRACCHLENNQRGLCRSRATGDTEGSGGTETKVPSLPNQADKAQKKVEPSLPQADENVNSEHSNHNEPKFIFSHFIGKAGYRACPNSPQSCRGIVRLKCSSTDCQMPNLEASVPAVPTQSELSGQSLLIKTL
ncbi:protein dispatched homolog 1 isoform X3 [Peromyscus californicus insignis]|uniref:protein dispatched homolog 1 isoform X3 n=1 Tax=Peromyscus californicus insignis TaxID=564181 RepID=UPI0022A7461A|nr:protein dispatched homolog 1 isoform X3 [Peromyscus californicus insignis]